MRTGRQQKLMMYVVLASVAVVALGPGWATAAYDRDNDRQYQDQQQYQDQGDQSYQQPPRSTQAQGRDMRLEQQIASRLRQQGYGTQGEIMILATGNRIILLGTVPDNRTKEGAEKAAKQIATRQSIDNRLHVRAQARRVSDAQLEKDTTDKLSDELGENIQIQARNGTVTLQGQLDNWRQVADAIDAAFAAGARQVNSQFSVAGAGAMAQGEAAGAYPPYGYAPGQQRQPPSAPRGRQDTMGAQRQATSTDLRLAQQVADQLRQQLPQRQNVQPIQPQSIYVTVQQGTVTLHGYVQSSSQKQQAAQIVQSIRGVRNIRNDLTILSTRGATGQAGGQEQWQDQDAQSGWQSQSSRSQSQQQGFGDTGSQSRTMSSSDRRLAQTVQQQLQNQFPDSNINVTVNQGTVTLRGTVQDNNEKQEAEQIVQSVSGVQNVQNNLRASGQAGSFPPQGYIPGQDSQDQSYSQSGQSQQGSRSQDQFGQSSQSQQRMDSQDQYSSQSSRQQDFGGTAGQNQYGQRGQAGAQQGFGDQSQYGQGAQMGGGQARMSASDMNLAQQIVQQLRQQLPGIQNVQITRPGTIYVMAAQGTVMLHGSVQSTNISQQATRIAQAVPGVQNIQSTLRAGAAAGGQAYGYVPGQERQGADQGAAEQDQGMMGRDQGTQGSAQMRQIAAQRGQSETGRASQSDMMLAHQAAQKLWQQLTGFQNIQVMMPGTIYVKASNGTITLEGYVSDNRVKQQAEQVIKSISGVQNVRNSLNVAPAGTALGYIPGSESESEPFESELSEDEQLGDQEDQDRNQEDRSDEGAPY